MKYLDIYKLNAKNFKTIKDATNKFFLNCVFDVPKNSISWSSLFYSTFGNDSLYNEILRIYNDHQKTRGVKF